MEDDVREWLSGLCKMVKARDGSNRAWMQPCKTDAERLKVVHELLRHKASDRMSSEDVAVCLRAVELLQGGM